MKRWDSYDAYLFDIDGTLLTCRDAVHYFAFCNALSEVAERPLNLDGVTTQGNVDNGILRDALTRAGIAESHWRPRLPHMQTRMCVHVLEHADEFAIDVMDGVEAVLKHLRSRGALLGVATGNLASIGRAKLEACVLLSHFQFGAFSDAHESRADVFREAVEHARMQRGTSASICVVGDTPADVQAAHANAVDVIAVATGIYPLTELAREAPTRTVASLTELLLDGDPA